MSWFTKSNNIYKTSKLEMDLVVYLQIEMKKHAGG
jgi:hypothetical protein